MRKFYEWIVEHTKTVLTAFLVLTVLSIFMKDLVEVDYDINDYRRMRPPPLHWM